MGIATRVLRGYDPSLAARVPRHVLSPTPLLTFIYPDIVKTYGDILCQERMLTREERMDFLRRVGESAPREADRAL